MFIPKKTKHRKFRKIKQKNIKKNRVLVKSKDYCKIFNLAKENRVKTDICEEREVLRGRRKDSAKLLKEYSDAEEVNETLIVSQDAEKKIKEINGALEYTCKITKAANGEPTKSFKKI